MPATALAQRPTRPTRTTRRAALQTLLGASGMALATWTTGCASLAPGAAEPGSSLDAIGRSKGLRVGAALGMPYPGSTQQFGFNDARVRDLLLRECGLLVCENEMKWQALRPAEGRYDWQRADAMVDWALEHRLLMRGHTLLWMDQVFFPDWLKAYAFDRDPAAARRQAEALLAGHVDTVTRRYAARIDSWDVVNEAVNPETGGLRSNPLSDRLGGIDTVELAFRHARAQAPQAQLVYNDYMGWGPGSAKHRAGVLQLLAELKRRGAPVDALGLQGHVGTAGDGSPMDPQGGDERAWRQFLDEASALGLDLLVTEFDINDRYLGADIAQRDRQVADIATLFLDITLSYRNLHTLVFWGLADHQSWLQNRWPRDDGRPKRPLPFDAELKAKPLREATAQALQRMPARQPRRTG